MNYTQNGPILLEQSGQLLVTGMCGLVHKHGGGLQPPAPSPQPPAPLLLTPVTRTKELTSAEIL